MNNFDCWRLARNSRSVDENVPENLFINGEEEVNFWLMRYVLETRKSNSQLFPPKTIYLLLSGILRHARQVNTHAPNFLDKNNIKFQSLHAVLDNLFKELQKDGVAKDTKHAEIIAKEDEIKLWETNVIGTKNPKALLQAVFYLNGKKLLLKRRPRTL